MRRRWRRAWPAPALLLAAAAGAAALLALPFPSEELARCPAATLLTDRGGQPLRRLLGANHADCRPTYRPDPSHWICKAVVAAEDKRFWRHCGVDPLAALRALGQNLIGLRRVSGASTLSTQVIRLAHPRPRTLAAKVLEAFRALQMERRLGKREILEQYLNRAPFGSNLVGIEAASRRYFAKGPAELSLAEAALLAGLPQSPSRLRPDRHPAPARARQAYVLGRMVAVGAISPRERDAALAQPIAVRAERAPFAAPHFCDWVALRAGAPPSGGAPVRTTLDGALQQTVEATLARHAPALRSAGISGAAIVVLDVPRAAVRAWVGSPDFSDAARRGQVNAAAMPRSAGSTLKPFAYALAFERGIATPRKVYADVPMAFRDYAPGNFDGTFRGLVSARDALILSLNMPALSVEREVGQPLLHATLRRLGLGTLNRAPEFYGAGLVLGNGEVTLIDLANAYACLARGGEYRPCRALESEPPAAPERVFSAEAAWLVAEALGGEERAADATGHAADVRLPRMAWKTGTSSGFRDAWTLGYNPQCVIGVWIGNVDGSPSPELVGKRAAPIVWEILRSLYPANDGPWFDRPAGVERREVCAVSGCPPGPHCPRTAEDWFVRGVSPFDPCGVHRRPPGPDGSLAERWPPEVEAFLGARHALADGAPAPAAAAVRITSPRAGSEYRMTAPLAGQEQRLPLAATAGRGAAPLHWFVNDRFVGTACAGAPLFWALQPGRYAIVCCDAAGRNDRCEISVR